MKFKKNNASKALDIIKSILPNTPICESTNSLRINKTIPMT